MVLWVAVCLTVCGVLPLQLVVLWAAVPGSRGSSLPVGLLQGWAPACGRSGLGDMGGGSGRYLSLCLSDVDHASFNVPHQFQSYYT